ncbi:T32E20.30 [Cucumis melo var. makuwa]|uniref:T32E20.30 n=1 Tax=Cucumis melo var. makuwa TaxID=1194695 RepID=A0A5D3E0C5_CUCMM|nr:T32E20.30 [Cucumis melo var. makuwa]TYK29151.1 T32E20.30 [Cucumis melo var. makuwa]
MPPKAYLYNLTAPTLIVLVAIKEEVEKDNRSKEIMTEQKKNEEGADNYFMQHGMLRCKGRLVILKASSLAVYGHLPPPLIYYRDWETPNSTLDEQMKERDVTLGRRNGSSKIRPYRQIGPVAYKLELPSIAAIYPVFHVSQLKMLGEHAKVQRIVPCMSENHEWKAVLEEIIGYQKNASGVWEVLIS